MDEWYVIPLLIVGAVVGAYVLTTGFFWIVLSPSLEVLRPRKGPNADE